jgi:hypothetical protein
MPDANGNIKGIAVPASAKWPPARPPRTKYVPPDEAPRKKKRRPRSVKVVECCDLCGNTVSDFCATPLHDQIYNRPIGNTD